MEANRVITPTITNKDTQIAFEILFSKNGIILINRIMDKEKIIITQIIAFLIF